MLEDVFQEVVSWEKKPVSELLGTISVGDLEYSKQIIMYGPTQVGKTTLILDLIGIKSEKRNELDEILRGGSKAGTASTSSAIIYSKWDKECFGISTRNIHDSEDKSLEELNAKQMRERITEINSQNRSGEKATLKYSDIYCFYFPASYFDDSSPLKNLQIIDLPGFGERNEEMRKRADEIASFISGFAAGAVVVVRSQNIQKLESDYKEFISKHHINHLAIAVSYAAATNFDVKKFYDDELSDIEIAHKITKYYYDLIQQDGYMDLRDIEPRDIIFPVEKKEYLKENLPYLYDAFEETRKMLVRKIASMNNRTSISFCTEQLEMRNKELLQKIETAKQEQKFLIKYEKDYKKDLNSIERSKKKYDEEAQEVEKKLDNLSKTERILKKRAKHFSEKRFTDSDARAIWESVSSKSDIDKRNEVHSQIEGYVNECIGQEEDFFDKILYETARKTAEKNLNDFDVDDFLKARGFTRHGKKWCKYAVSSISLFVDDLSKSVITDNEEKSKELFEEIDYKRSIIEKKRAEQENAINILENKIKRNQNEQASLIDYIKVCQEQIQSNIKSKENVKAVFIKHFYLKQQELEERIENEPSPEMKTALFLVLSSIYLSMKSYLEENKYE